MHKSGQIILWESDRPHIKDDEKSENNMRKKCVWKDDMIYEMVLWFYLNQFKEQQVWLLASRFHCDR